MKRIILFGMPGAGKGTQARKIEKKLGYQHMSTGSMIRKEIEQGSALGLEIKALTLEGKLIPDELIIQLVKDYINKGDFNQGYQLDGFPRTIKQAEELSKIAVDEELALFLEINEKEVISRILSRISCSNCQAIYNLKLNPPKEKNKCDECGQEMISRSDDNEDIIKKRLNVYRKETFPLIEFYEQKNKLIRIDAIGDENQVFNTILEKI